ncbi:hypothetical protein ACFL6U_08600 [Planctomycetota bacterium]
MLIVLPVCCWILFFLFFYLRAKEACWRSAFLAASVVLGTFIVLITELLSLPYLLNFTTVLMSWLLLLGFGVWLVSKAWPLDGLKVSFDRTSLSRGCLFLLAGIGLYILVIALIAIISPPNSWDVMAYHMPKVMHWIQNETVRFIPTAVPRINHQNPGSEFILLHLQLLSGSDRFANMSEWFSMVGSLIAVSLIAQRLGAKLRGQLLAVIFSLTLPMGIMQASSSQADYVSAFWLACFVVYMLKIIDSKSLCYGNAMLAAAALGVAVVTKATTYVYAPPFGLWFLVCFVKHRKHRAVKPLLVMATIVIALKAGHWVRNYDLNGKILGPGKEPRPNTKYSNDTFAPKSLISNTVKYAAIHLNTPWQPVQDKLIDAVVSFHEWLGVDINDPRTTWGRPGPRRFRINTIQYYDEADGNPIHIILFVLCLLIVPFFKRLRLDRPLVLYGLSVLAAFLFFTCYVKWAIWNTRVHLALFVLAGPFVGLVLARLFKWKWMSYTVALVLLGLGLPWLLNCQQRPLIRANNIFNMSRLDLCFTHTWRSGKQDYQALQNYLEDNDLGQVGLYAGNFAREYISWTLLKKDNPDVRIQAVNMTDVSQCKLELPLFKDFQPDTVLSINQRQSDSLLVKDTTYTKQWSAGRLAIYQQESQSNE